MTAWKEFEQLAATIYQELLPYAQVKHDDQIWGNLSESYRQIDVSIRYSIGGHDLLAIIQARDKSRPADVNAVGEFATVIEDVKANKGILVCRSGFTAIAKSLAKNKGIEVCNIHDAQSRRWVLDIKFPIMWLDLLPLLRVEGRAWMDKGDSIPKEVKDWVISVDRGKTRINFLTTFVNAWNAGQLPRAVGPQHFIRPNPSRYEIRVWNKADEVCWRNFENFHLSYTVSQKSWLGSFTPEECRGVLNYRDGIFHPSYLPIGSIPTKRDSSWQQVEDPDKLAITIPGYFVTTEGWQIEGSSVTSKGTEIFLISSDP